MNLHLCVVFTLAVLAAAACDGSRARVSPPPSATDPIIGTWRLKVAESTFSTAMQDVRLENSQRFSEKSTVSGLNSRRTGPRKTVRQ